MSRTGATHSVQRSLGWIHRDKHERMAHQTAHCYCGAEMRFDVRDPMGIGRSMQQCSDPTCPNHRVHLVTADPDLPPPRDPPNLRTPIPRDP